MIDNTGRLRRLVDICTEARLAELDAANMPATLDTIINTYLIGMGNYLTSMAGSGFSTSEHSLVAITNANLSSLIQITDTVKTRLASTPLVGGHAPATVTVTEGTIAASGTIANIQTINQDYLKIEESGSVGWTIDTTYTNIDEQHTEFFVAYRYTGPGNSAHVVEVEMWNYQTLDFDHVASPIGTKDLPATEVDAVLSFVIDGSGTLSDYYEYIGPGNYNAELRIHHASTPIAEHRFWLDAIGIGELEIIYTAPDNAGISTTLDTVVTETQKIISIIESQRGHHTATGNVFYWDPINGNDDNTGLVPIEAKKTYDFADATGGIHGLLTDSNHDLVIVLPGSPSGPTEINEYIEIDHRYTFIRGMGRDIFINSTHDQADSILLSAEGGEISGMRVNTKTTGSQNGIRATGDFCHIHSVWVDYARSNGIIIDNASDCFVSEFDVEHTGYNGDGHGLVIKGDVSLTERNRIASGNSSDNNEIAGTDGIRITGAYAKNNYIYGAPMLISHENTGWGINETNGADHNTIVGPGLYLKGNTLGTINMLGVNSTAINIEQWAKSTGLDDIKGTGFDTDQHSLTDIKNRIG